jgi:hypothetical protein
VAFLHFFYPIFNFSFFALQIVKHLRWVNDNLGLPEPSGKHPLLGFLPLFAEYANKDTLDTLIANLFKEVPQKTIHLPGSFAFKYVGTRDLDFIKMIFTDIGASSL